MSTPVERLLYVVPYLNDPAVVRRLRMLRLGGIGEIVPIGFRRTAEPVREIDGRAAIDLGRTEDGRLVRRIASLARGVRAAPRWGRQVGSASIILARSLEALVLARAYRRRFTPQVPLVYESLDIHRLQLGSGAPARALRALEAHAMADCSLVLTSSPGFVREYFRRHFPVLPPMLVLENKLLAAELDPELLAPPRPAPIRPGPPWVIGWFGLLRCRRSLLALAALCRAMPGRVRVEIRGRPAVHLVDELPAVVADTPAMTFHGPYERRELPALYAGVHLSWTLDFFEQGANSDWLLPNRLYEAGPFGSVPLAAASVETGRWLADRGAGLLLADPVEQTLPSCLAALDETGFATARARMRRIPLEDFVDGPEHAAALVERLRTLRPPGP